jgi:hypothetical protein
MLPRVNYEFGKALDCMGWVYRKERFECAGNGI